MYTTVHLILKMFFFRKLIYWEQKGNFNNLFTYI